MDNIAEEGGNKETLQAMAKKVACLEVTRVLIVMARSSCVFIASSVCREDCDGHIGDGNLTRGRANI